MAPVSSGIQRGAGLMRSNARRGGVVMFVQAATTAATLFLLYRLLLRSLGAEQMGIWALLSAITMLGRLADLGVSNSVVKLVAREVAHGRDVSAALFMQSAILFVALASGGILLGCYPAFSYSLIWLLPSPAHATVSAILPILLGSTWLTIVATTVYGGLDATQRYDLRGVVLIVNSIVQLIAAAALVPEAGLQGMAWALVVQWSVTIGLGWILVRRQLSALPVLPCLMCARHVRELVSYGLKIQANWVLVLLMDPVTKSLLSCFGTLEMVAYYDMASRLVLQFRQLTVSSVQILTAIMAELSEIAPTRIRSIYTDAFRLLLVTSIVGYAGLSLCMPVISTVWIGRVEPWFLAFALIITGASLINTLSCPAFFANLGLGRVRENTISLAIQAVATGGLGAALGLWFGGAGVVIGTALAMMAGSVALIASFGRAYRVQAVDLCQARTIHVLLGAAVAVAAGYYLQHAYAREFGIWLPWALSLAQFAVIALPTMWFHPVRRTLLGHPLEK
jgi:O-antigen/teichoic acid export membrane protein